MSRWVNRSIAYASVVKKFGCTICCRQLGFRGIMSWYALVLAPAKYPLIRSFFKEWPNTDIWNTCRLCTCIHLAF